MSMNAINELHQIDQDESAAIIHTVNVLATRVEKSGEDIAFEKSVTIETEQGDYWVYVHIERKK